MTVEIKGANELIAVFREIEDFLKDEKPMQGIVDDIADLVQTKTEKGLDYRSRKFEPYSPAYAKKKGTSRANLKDTGKMLDAIDTKVLNANHGKVFVESRSYTGKGKRARTDMVAQIHNTGTGKQPEREFMNITPSALKKLKKKHYDDPLLKITRKTRY